MNWQLILVLGAVLTAAAYLAIRAVRRLRRERAQQSACAHCGLQRSPRGRSTPAG